MKIRVMLKSENVVAKMISLWKAICFMNKKYFHNNMQEQGKISIQLNTYSVKLSLISCQPFLLPFSLDSALKFKEKEVKSGKTLQPPTKPILDCLPSWTNTDSAYLLTWHVDTHKSTVGTLLSPKAKPQTVSSHTSLSFQW